MKLFHLLALNGLNAYRRQPQKDRCDRDLLPDIEHAEWVCKYNGFKSKNQKPETVKLFWNKRFFQFELLANQYDSVFYSL